MYIPKRKVVCAMITEIDFKVKGEERKKLAYAIGELLGMFAGTRIAAIWRKPA